MQPDAVFCEPRMWEVQTDILHDCCFVNDNTLLPAVLYFTQLKKWMSYKMLVLCPVFCFLKNKWRILFIMSSVQFWCCLVFMCVTWHLYCAIRCLLENLHVSTKYHPQHFQSAFFFDQHFQQSFHSPFFGDYTALLKRYIKSKKLVVYMLQHI